MKNKRPLTLNEKHTLLKMEGKRTGSITAVKRICFNIIRRKAKEQNFSLSKLTLQKIKRETEVEFLYTLIFKMIDNKITAEYIETNYDKLFLLPVHIRNPDIDREFDPMPLKTK